MEDRLWKLQSDLNTLNTQLIVVANKIDAVEKGIPSGTDPIIQSDISKMKGKIQSIENRVNGFSKEITNMWGEINKFPDLPDTKLLSNSLLDRALAVTGHAIVGQIFLYIIIGGIILVLSLILGVLT